MPLPTPQQIDAALPVNGEPNRAGVNALLKAFAAITKNDLGLDKAANLTPAEYPVSTETAQALETLGQEFSQGLSALSQSTTQALAGLSETISEIPPISTEQAAINEALSQEIAGIPPISTEQAAINDSLQQQIENIEVGGSSPMPAARVVEQILRQAEVAYQSNPYALDTMTLSSPPTMNNGLVLPAGGFTRAYTPAPAGRNAFNMYGGEPVMDDWGVRLPAITMVEGRRNLVGMYETVFDGDSLVAVVEAGNHGVRWLVKEGSGYRRVTTNGMSPVAGSGRAYYQLTFPNRQRRHVALEVFYGPSGDSPRFGGFLVKDQHQCFRPRYVGPRTFIMSDSNVMGVNGPGADGYLRVALAYLGIKDVWLNAAGSTGVDKSDDPIALSYQGRRVDWTGHGIQLAFFNMSWNDFGGNRPAKTAAMIAEIQACRAANPNAIILLMGLHDTFDGPNSAASQAWNDATEEAVIALNDNYIRFVSTLKGPEGPWTGDWENPGAGGNFGNGYMNGHYTQAGDLHLAVHVANALLEVFEAMSAGAAASEVPPLPATILPASGSVTGQVGVVLNSTLLGTVSRGTPSGVTGAVPAGLTATIVGQQLRIAGTPTAEDADFNSVLTVATNNGNVSFNLSAVIEPEEVGPTDPTVTDPSITILTTGRLGTDGATSYTDELGNVWEALGSARMEADDAMFPPLNMLIPDTSSGSYFRLTNENNAGAVLGAGAFAAVVWVDQITNEAIYFDNDGENGVPGYRFGLYSAGQLYWYSDVGGFFEATIPTGPQNTGPRCFIFARNNAGVVSVYDGVNRIATYNDSTNYSRRATNTLVGRANNNLGFRPFAGAIQVMIAVGSNLGFEGPTLAELPTPYDYLA